MASEKITEVKTTKPAPAELDGAAAFRAEPRFFVTVHRGEGEEGKRAATPGINGYVLSIPRGVKVPVPESFVKALEEINVYETDPETGERSSRPRWSFALHGPAN